VSLSRFLLAARMFAPVVGRLPTRHLLYLLRRLRDERPHRFGRQVRVNSFFPPWPSPAFDRFCAALVARRRVPHSAYVAVTSRCPCQCAHCSYAGRPPAEPSAAQLRSLVAELKGLGGAILGITGGEPLLRDDLEELVRAAKPELATIVFTTGRGLDRPRAATLRDAGLDYLTLGLESADPARHDAVRGLAGSFAEAEGAAAACREAGLYLAISTVATRERLAAGELDRLHALADQWGARELRVLSPGATGGLAGRPEAMLSPAERDVVRRFHVERNRAGRGPAVAAAAHLESDELFGCGAGYHHVFVDAAGEVCPCDLAPWSFGNAYAGSLAAIWARMGETFPRPRCGCLQAGLASRLAPGMPLPVPPAETQAGIAPTGPGAPVPGGYRRLL
jgi:MoaA/NifB/PqqE/SkfB family radical SAM enzyme